MKKVSLIASSILILFIFTPQKVLGMGIQDCQLIYGGGESCIQSDEITINTTTKNPTNGTYVENLSNNDPKYIPGQTVPFKITITNNTNKTLSSIKIKDVLPQYVDFYRGSGTFDTKTKSLNFTVDKLNKNEMKAFFLEGKVTSKDNLPTDRNTICLINEAIATADNKISQDNSQFCVTKTTSQLTTATQPITNPPTTKGGLPVYEPTQSKSTPQTGSEALSLIGLVPAGALGFWLRKKADK